MGAGEVLDLSASTAWTSSDKRTRPSFEVSNAKASVGTRRPI